MNWAKQNKFLTGYLATTIVSAGVLGYLVFSAKGKYDEASSTFDQQSAELKRLESSKPFPSADNVKILEGQRNEHQAKVEELQKKLAATELPLEQVSPEQFQDSLRKTVTAFKTKAAGAGMKIPDNFFMGFGRYETAPPRPEAASLLARQLKTIELVLSQLADNKVAELRALNREELPEERAGKPGDAPQQPAPGRGGAGGGRGGGGDRGKETVKKAPFELVIFTGQPEFQRVLNAIVSNQTQFVVPRVVTIKNEKETGPSRFDLSAGGAAPAVPPPADAGTPPASPAAGGAATPAAPDAAATPPGAPAAPVAAGKFIVGEERVEVAMLLELVDFPEVAEPAGSAKGPAAKTPAK